MAVLQEIYVTANLQKHILVIWLFCVSWYAHYEDWSRLVIRRVIAQDSLVFRMELVNAARKRRQVGCSHDDMQGLFREVSLEDTLIMAAVRVTSLFEQPETTQATFAHTCAPVTSH